VKDAPDTPVELHARALRLLARREHSRAELASKLAPRAQSPEALNTLLDALEQKKQLSNERFAEARAHQLARKYGAARIRQDLKAKGIAASLVIASLSLALNLDKRLDEVPQVVSFDRSIDHLQSEYLQVRNPLVQEFGKTNENLDPVVLEDLYKNIEIMEQARREIEDQVRKNPENRRLVEMLMNIHERELELLKRDYTQPTRSM